MADDAAVLDAPVLEVTDEVVDPATPETVEPAEVAEPVEVKGDERVMPQWIKNLKATDPLGFKAAKADFFGKRALDEKLKDFDLDGTKAFLEEHGGRESLATVLTDLQGKAAELDSINQAISEGKTEILDSIPAESLAKLAPAVAQKWAEHDPEGWSAAMSGVMAATINQSGIPMFLERMGDALQLAVELRDTPAGQQRLQQLSQNIDQLKEWTGSFAGKAAAPRAQQTAKIDDKLSQREQNVAQQEAKAFNEQMGVAVETFRQPLITKELDSFIKRRPNDADAKEHAIKTVKNDVIDRLKSDQKYQDALNALWARKDRDGALKLIKSRETAAIQEIAPKVGRMIFGNPAGTPVVQKQAGTPSKPEAGFSFTDKPPRPDLIDRGKTSDAMIMRGKFILKDGSRLTLEA